jgi:transcriptional regulator with XRE-family HTH domain
MIASEKIRKIRRFQKLSLEELSVLTGLSTSYLSQVERGIVNPSLSALNKIAESLDISIASLLEQKSDNDVERIPYSVINPEQRHKLI